jgi:hypothetical protein
MKKRKGPDNTLDFHAVVDAEQAIAEKRALVL